MTNNELLAFTHNGRKFYVDRLKITFILAKKYNYDVSKMSDKIIAKILKEKGLVDKDFFVRINKL